MTLNANNLTNYNMLYANGDINLNIRNQLLNKTDNNIVNLGNDTATIYATNNINIGNSNLRTNSVKNLSANIETKSGDINIVANDVLNARTQTLESLYEVSNSVEDYRGVIDYGFGSWSCQDIPRVECYAANGSDDFYWLYFNEYNLKVDMTMVNRYKGEGTRTTIDGVRKKDDITSKQSTIYSGHNLNIDANKLTNEISLISSVNNIDLKNSNMSIENKNISFGANLMFDNYTGAGSFDYYYLDSSTPFFITPHQDYSIYSYSSQGEIINSTIEAGGVITGDAGSLQNGANKQINYTVYSPSSNKTNTNTANINFQTGIKETNNTSSRDVPALDKKTQTIDSSTIDEALKLPTNKYGMFTTVDPNKNLNYLVETNPLYTNLSNYIGSQYFLDKMNYKSDRVTKRLGDAAYETSLVRDSIVKQTGQRFLSDYASENAQFVALMDNAVNMSGVLGLEIGKAPTTEQLSKLTENIVWMEERVVDGQSVLVPVVYLSSDYEYLKGANIVAQKGIDLNVKDSVTNTGNIKSNDYINLNARTITNNS